LVYLQPFRRNSLLKCVPQPEITKNSVKPPIFLGGGGGSRSSMLTFLSSSSPVLVVISSMSVPICGHFRVKWASNSIIMSSQRGCPYFAPRSWELPWPSSMKFCHEILGTPGYHMVKTRTLSPGIQSVPGCDGQTDVRTELP